MKAHGVSAAGLIALLLVSHVAQAEVIRVQAKSFIAAVDLRDHSQFDSANACGEKFQAFAVNCTLWGGENPKDGNLDTGEFRLWSQVNVDAQCNSNKITKWNFSGITSSFGKEAFFQTSGDVSKRLSTSASPAAASAADRVDFSYKVRGQPIAAVNAALASARPRTCTFIWHEVSGSLTCSNGTPTIRASLAGSGFPSHRVWVNDRKAADLPQGAFKKLWDCDPVDPTSVR